jgi:leucyl aminopeptidase
MKLEVKNAPEKIPGREFTVCLLEPDVFFFMPLPEPYQRFAEEYRQDLKKDKEKEKEKEKEAFVLPVDGIKRGYLYFASPSSVEYFPRTEAFKIIASEALLKAEKLGCEVLSFLVNAPGACDIVPLLTEGIVLGDYRFDRYVTKDRKRERRVGQVFFYCRREDRDRLSRIVRETHDLGEMVNGAREITNEPGGVMTPVAIAREARLLELKYSLQCHVMNEKRLKREGYNGLLTVGSGSQNPPRLIVLSYIPRKARGKKHLCVVGKGITFDTGGVCLKPQKNLWEMKADMAGAASAIYIVAAAAQRKIPMRVTAVVPAAENMLGSRATLPGNIFRAKNGKTVQVENTDAEGRLIMTDAFAMAETLKPTHIVDLATLTGSCIVALGTSISGLFGDDANFTRMFFEAAEVSGENFCELPLHKEYLRYLKCDYADINNFATGRDGGAISAALFLSEFKPAGVPWIHLDIAGTALTKNAWKYFRPGATGVGIRTLVRLAARLSGE